MGFMFLRRSQASKNIDASSYRVGSLSSRRPFGTNEKELKDEGLGFGFHVSAARCKMLSTWFLFLRDVEGDFTLCFTRAAFLNHCVLRRSSF